LSNQWFVLSLRRLRSRRRSFMGRIASLLDVHDACNQDSLTGD
jgi:hypothetical protein